jgi:hypothetical protein
LLAHELAHVVQLAEGRPARVGGGVGLQRTAGNRAVTGLLIHRQAAAAPAARAVGGDVRPEVERLLKAFGAASGYDAKNRLAMQAVHAVIRAYGLSTKGLYQMRLEPHLKTDRHAETFRVRPGRQSLILFAPSAFERGFERFVHVVAHELTHVQHALIGRYGDARTEFLAYAFSILQAGPTAVPSGGGHVSILGALKDLPALPPLPPKPLAADAREALANWRRMSARERARDWQLFEGVRRKLLERITREAPPTLRPPTSDRSSPAYRRWYDNVPPVDLAAFTQWIEERKSPWAEVKARWVEFDAWAKAKPYVKAARKPIPSRR